MPIVYKKTQAQFDGVVTVEEAEGLLQWLQNKPHATVHFGACSHLHPANLQVLMAAASSVAVWPTDAGLHSWLLSALRAKK
jgi:hypothetical protein